MAFNPLGKFDRDLSAAVFGDEHHRRPAFFYDSVTFQGATRRIVIEDGTIKGFILDGDLLSINWDGANPANLATKDGTATAGYYFDTSEGSMQLMGDMFLGGDISLAGGTLWTKDTRTSSDHYIGMGDPFSSGTYQAISWWKGTTQRAEVGVGTGTYGIMTFNADSGADWSAVSATQTAFELAAGDYGYGWGRGMVDLYVGLRNMSSVARWYAPSGTTGAPGIAFTNDTDTGMYRYGTNIFGVAAGANSRFTVANSTAGGVVRVNGGNTAVSATASGGGGFIISNTNTGRTVTDLQMAMGVHTAGNVGWIQVVKPGTSYYTMLLNPKGGLIALGPGVYNNTTGSGSNMVLGASPYQLLRSTSARKYKSRINYNVDALADIELKPAKFYRKDDKAWSYGFIADDVANEDKLLGVYEDDEIENYHLNGVVAVLAAKVNRLEKMLDV